MKTIALLYATLIFFFFLVIGNYDQADASLQSFYAQMLSADFNGARQSIEKAVQLWPANARYSDWHAYSTGQRLPSHCFHGGNSVMNAADQAAATEAMADYRLALELNSRDAVAYHNLAWLKHLLRDDVGAGEDWREALVIDPDNACRLRWSTQHWLAVYAREFRSLRFFWGVDSSAARPGRVALANGQTSNSLPRTRVVLSRNTRVVRSIPLPWAKIAR